MAVNQSNYNSIVTSINRAGDTIGLEKRDTIVGSGGMSDPINFGLKKDGSGGPVDSSGLRGPGNQTLNTEAVLAAVEESGKCCRICLEDEEDVESGNPFITPCKCTGSMKYIHLKCLREWTDSKKQF